MTAGVLWAALAAVLAYALAPLHSSRVSSLPRHAGQTRPSYPVEAPEAGPAHTVPPVGPAGTAAASSMAGEAAAVPLPLAVETPVLYRTDALPLLSLHDEDWWDG